MWWTKDFAMNGRPVYTSGEWRIYQHLDCVEVSCDSGCSECYDTVADAMQAVEQMVDDERERLEALAVLDALAESR